MSIDHVEPCLIHASGQVGLSIIIRFLFGGELATSVFIAGIVTMIYTGAGGLLSVAYTGETRHEIRVSCLTLTLTHAI